MATQRIESGQMQLRSVGGVPMTQITPREVDYVGVRAQAETANVLSKIVDRMSQSAFEMAGKAVQERAMFDVATNPLTPEQLEIAKNGDMSQLGIGSSNFNIYDATVRKARSFELASAFDTEAKAEVVKILSDIENGTATSEQAATKLNTMTKGFSQSLAKVDPDASLKFAASMGVYANTVMAEAYKTEQKRTKEKQALLLESNFTNTMKLVEPLLTQGFYVDDSGVEQSVDKKLEVHRDNIAQSALFAGGLQMSKEYLAKFDAKVAEAKVNALTKYFTSEENISNPQEQLRRLKRGDAGRMSVILQQMIANDFDSVVKVEANIMQANANRVTLRKDEEAQNKLNLEKQSNSLLIEYYSPKTTTTRKRQIGVDLAKMGVLSVDQIEKFLDPKVGDGDPYAFANLETRIVFGEITDPDQLKREASRTGMSGPQFARLNSKLLEGFNQEKSEAYRYLRRVSGVPDVSSSFASKDDQHKITKNERLTSIFDGKVDEYRNSNPGAAIPFRQLSRDAEKVYNETDKADAGKANARKKLENYVEELKRKKKVATGFTIDENTNVDDLIRRGIVPANDRNDTAGFIQQQINILREAQR